MSDKSSSCNENCGSCDEDCNSREPNPADLIDKQHEMSNVKKVIGVVSGKGGVGKSLVTAMLASKFNKNYKTAILDADITGPSIPKIFGIKEKADGNEFGLFPAKTADGLSVISTNLLLDEETDPVIWRGPKIAGIVRQFWTDVVWGDIYYMFVDMPPGTGDVALTVFQNLPVDGLIIVTSPQDLVSMIVGKAVKMANALKIPIIGLVENMSYLECPDCGKQIEVFGKSKIDEIAYKYHVKVLDKIPINPKIAEACDAGKIGDIADQYLNNTEEIITITANRILNIFAHTMNTKIASPSIDGVANEHFGSSDEYTISTVQSDKVINREVVSAHPDGHSANVGMLKEKGVGIIICGNLGAGAKNAITQSEMHLIAGASGKIEDVVESFIVGRLKNNPASGCGDSHGGCGSSTSDDCGCGSDSQSGCGDGCGC